MRFVTAIAVSVLALLTTQPVAQAQAVCPIIARYFASSAPQAFVDERGALVKTGWWRSNQNLPNASCSIRLSTRGEHASSCIFNNNASLNTVVAWAKKVERDIDNCLERVGKASSFRKTTSTDSTPGEASTRTTWRSNEDGVTYTISLALNQSADDGQLYNAMRITWKPD
jgi:hypothetical protein